MYIHVVYTYLDIVPHYTVLTSHVIKCISLTSTCSLLGTGLHAVSVYRISGNSHIINNLHKSCYIFAADPICEMFLKVDGYIMDECMESS